MKAVVAALTRGRTKGLLRICKTSNFVKVYFKLYLVHVSLLIFSLVFMVYFKMSAKHILYKDKVSSSYVQRVAWM